jgi:hypothetical protein
MSLLKIALGAVNTVDWRSGLGSDRLTTYHRKIQLLGNLQCDLGTVKLGRIDLGSGKVYEMRIESRDVCTLSTAGGVNELVKDMDKCKVDMWLCKKLDGQRKNLR